MATMTIRNIDDQLKARDVLQRALEWFAKYLPAG